MNHVSAISRAAIQASFLNDTSGIVASGSDVIVIIRYHRRAIKLPNDLKL